MKIIVPIKNSKYLDKLIECGADEFYGGFIDPTWQHVYGTYIEYNRRGNYGKRANFESEKMFYEMVSECGKRDIPFYLTVNALKISDRQREYVNNIMGRFKNAGGTGVIFSDANILEDIREWNLKPVVSSCAEVINDYIADFYKKEKCKRIIFPRDITLGEMRNIVKNVPDMEYEMFFMNSGCRFTDGNCLSFHATEERALCEYCDAYPQGFYRMDGQPVEHYEEKRLLNNQEQFKNLWKNTCACCHLYDAKDFIHSLKIVERVASEEKLMKQIRLARMNVDIADRSSSKREYLERMIKPENSESFCKDYMSCYYRTDMLNDYKRLNDFEKNYKVFIDRFDIDDLKEKTEYVGVNLSIKDGKPHIDYKIYFNTKASLDEHHPIVDDLYEKGMLRAVTRIHDTLHGPCDRFDLGLAKRTKDNMEHFFDVMCEHSDVMRNHLDEIQQLNRMKISEKPEDASAALYFFGFLEKKGVINAVKTHFLTRFCANVDAIDTKDEYRDSYYLDFLNKTKIELFQKIIPIAETVLKLCEGHLWMVGVDYFENNPNKYKIYIKRRGLDLYAALREAIKQSKLSNQDVWISELELLECWHGRHTELLSDGIAISLDEKGNWSFNFYDFWK